MNPTLDTSAIRARFDGAIIGIRADGTMAVLLPSEIVYGPMPYLDLVTGISYTLPYNYAKQKFISDTFPTLIRPGDECEAMIGLAYYRVIYLGCVFAESCIKFSVSMDSQLSPYATVHIRPIPAPAVEQTREQKAVEMVKEVIKAFEVIFPESFPKNIMDGCASCGAWGNQPHREGCHWVKARAVLNRAAALFGEEKDHV